MVNPAFRRGISGDVWNTLPDESVADLAAGLQCTRVRPQMAIRGMEHALRHAWCRTAMCPDERATTPTGSEYRLMSATNMVPSKMRAQCKWSSNAS